MKSVSLAGGLGTRISEETYLKPKPMIEIGGRAMFSNQSFIIGISQSAVSLLKVNDIDRYILIMQIIGINDR